MATNEEDPDYDPNYEDNQDDNERNEEEKDKNEIEEEVSSSDDENIIDDMEQLDSNVYNYYPLHHPATHDRHYPTS